MLNNYCFSYVSTKGRPILSNIYQDKLDKELESRGLRFVRYADDSNIFAKSKMIENRVMKSITLERKLFLKVSANKTKMMRQQTEIFWIYEFVLQMSSRIYSEEKYCTFKWNYLYKNQSNREAID